MRSSIIYTFFLVLILASCSKKSPEILDTFPKFLELDVQESPLLCDKIGTPVDMIIQDSLLVVIDYYFKHNLSIIDLNSLTHLKHFGPTGRGPGELNHASNIMAINDAGEFGVFDDIPKRINKYLISDIISDDSSSSENYIKLNTDINLYMAVFINDSVLLATTGSFDNRYALINDKGKIIESFGEYPSSSDIKLPPEANPLTFQCCLEVKPDKNRFVSACYKSPILEIFDIAENVIESITKQHYGFPIVLPEITKTSRSVLTLSDNVYGFIDLSVTDNYIFALFSGRTINKYGKDARYGNIILVYGWSGESVNAIMLNKDLTSIVFDEKNNRIYGFAEDPEVKLYFVDLPKQL